MTPVDIDGVREEAARCAEETARWQRGERGPLVTPIDSPLLAEFSDAAFGVAAEVAEIVGREMHRLRALARGETMAATAFDTAAKLLRAGWQRGHRVLGHVVGRSVPS